MNPLYPSIARRAGHRCEYCHAPEAVFNFPFEIEHIYPVSQAGSDDTANLALALHSCNLHKSDRISGIDPTSHKLTRLFNPRTDLRDAHFFFTTENAIHGITPIGQATIELLRFNSAGQLKARLQWKRLGLI